MRKMRNSRLDTLFSGNENLPYARRYRTSARTEAQVGTTSSVDENDKNQEDVNSARSRSPKNSTTHNQDQCNEPSPVPEATNHEDETVFSEDLSNDQLSDDAIFDPGHYDAESSSQSSCVFSKAESMAGSGTFPDAAFENHEVGRDAHINRDSIHIADDFDTESNSQSSYTFSGEECVSGSGSLPEATFENHEDERFQAAFTTTSRDDLLHPQLAITKDEVLIMLMHIFIRHNLTNSALEDFLRLINVIIGFKSLPSTFYSFVSHFGTEQYTRHYVCNGCGLYMENNSEGICHNCNSNKKDFFVIFDLASSLKSILSKNWDQIVAYKSSLIEGQIGDVLQGQAARKLKAAYDILISFNTDGVAVFNSNVKKSLWPILVTINNLPPSLRFLRQNVIVAGLWLSNSEPDLDVFMKPFLDQLQVLARDGLSLFDNVSCKVITSCCCVDSVARCKLQQIKQFNGYEACSFCLHPGSLTESNQIRYKFLDVQKRNHQDTVRAMDLCMKRGVPVNGIKGVSSLLLIPFFDIITDCPVDYMHAVCLGVCKQFCGLWFEFSNNDYCIKRFIAKVDDIMTSIRSFQECSRSPRKISDRKSWKANEWQNWLLIYSSVCLKNFLPKRYYDHFQLLIQAIENLLNTHLTETHIAESERLLQLFVQNCETLYGMDEMKYNVHLLLHLASCARSFGPLWAFSLFCFEDLNGVLKKFIKGPKQPVVQIAARCTLAQKKEHIDLNTIKNYQAREFCESLSRYKQKSKCVKSNVSISTDLINTLAEQIPQQSFEERNLLIRNRYTFKPERRSSVINSDDATFTMTVKGEKMYGIIQRILYSNFAFYLIFKPIFVKNEQELLVGTELNDEKLVEVNDSIQKCVRMYISDKMFIRIVKYVPWVD